MNDLGDGLDVDTSDTKKHRTHLRNRAIYALARREHSYHELLQKLVKGSKKWPQGDEALSIKVMDVLLDEGLVSDERFSEQLCRSKFIRGFGPVRVRYELGQHNIESILIEQSMSEYETQWLDRLREVKLKKFGAAAAADYKTWAKQARFLQSRGFTSEQINVALDKS